VAQGHALVHSVALLRAQLRGEDAARESDSRLLQWYADQGWTNPERAAQMNLPLYPWLRRQLERS